MNIVEIGKYINIKLALELDHLPRSKEEANEYFELAEYMSEVYKKNNGMTSKNQIYFEEQKKLIYKKYYDSKDNLMKEKQTSQQVDLNTDNYNATSIYIFEEYLEKTKDRYEKKIDSFLLNEDVNNFQKNYQIMKNNQEWSEIFYWQNLVLDILNEWNSLWFDTRINKYCFRSKIGGITIYKNKDQISELLTRALKEQIINYLNQNNSGFFSSYAIEIVLVYRLKGIKKQQLNANEKASNVIKILLFENAISSIDDDRFEIQSPLEFMKGNNDLFYTRNRFISTKYLKKRFENGGLNYNYSSIIQEMFIKNDDNYLYEKNKQNSEIVTDCKGNSFITQFIFYLVDEDCHLYYYVMNWLACFFNSLEKSGTALVLLGDQEVIQNILWDKIIKEIFGLQHCISINDEECVTASSFEIAKDKLFFHIADITNPATKFDDETLYKLVKDLLTKPSISKVNENNEIDDVTVHGQMIITAKNPFPYIKRAMSKCTIIKVNDMDTIIEKLGIPDELILEDKIQKDLDNFADILRSFQGNNSLPQYALDTEDRGTIKNNKSSNIDKEDIDNKIDDFIQAIKDQDLKYFEKVKDIDDDEIYEHLQIVCNKHKGYFIGRDLLDYYNAIHEQKFTNKKQLMDKLKDKDDMFNQETKTLKILDKDQKEEVLFQAYQTSKETKNKELYKITDYKMAKDIKIPYGATVISSQEKLEKFACEDMEDRDDCIKRTEEYRVKEKERKAKEKERKAKEKEQK
ncbi:hypothetical protein [Sulfurimonas sp.]|uniref:hypothetical protein n=1 Tax=Sulfurimonas sp. TaxID=2022749 RepID=UPI002624F254|nr:hypothetical protein [Sulfurimonas sp.]MCW8895000.1 hypothetical protein [Sulfurimonas sp.]